VNFVDLSDEENAVSEKRHKSGDIRVIFDIRGAVESGGAGPLSAESLSVNRASSRRVSELLHSFLIVMSRYRHRQAELTR